MIFRRPMLELVLSGEKVITRRVGVFEYKPGKTYAVQPGRGQFHVAHIRIVCTWPEHLGLMSIREARLEGFSDLSAFIDYWKTLHGTWDNEQVVTRIRFELAPRCPECKETP